ncbi:MAG TPA: D-arabinono-1,4-lactone oxidase [Pseudomonadales bacterium]
MARWSNWSGRLTARPRAIHFARSEADAAALLKQAAAAGIEVRAAGAGHSHAPLVPSDGIVLDTSGLAGLIDADPSARTATVGAGTLVYALGAPLHRVGLALINQGDIDRQSIGGACATGTHGTGRTLQNLSAQVLGVRLALISGELVDCDAEREPELWQAARLGLGALGVVTALTLRVRDAYRLQERSWTAPLETLLPDVDRHAAAARHFEFFWYPEDDRAVAKLIVETDAPPRYPVGDEGSRIGWSHEVLPSHRPHPHTEMEYAVPASAGEACLLAIRELIRRQFPAVRWPVEYRTVAADDVWLSQAFERDVVTISVHQDVREDETRYFRACEEVFLDHQGRPHWGKLRYLGRDQLAARHPAWARWWAVRDAVDPAGRLLNDHLRALRP